MQLNIFKNICVTYHGDKFSQNKQQLGTDSLNFPNDLQNRF